MSLQAPARGRYYRNLAFVLLSAVCLLALALAAISAFLVDYAAFLSQGHFTRGVFGGARRI